MKLKTEVLIVTLYRKTWEEDLDLTTNTLILCSLMHKSRSSRIKEEKGSLFPWKTEEEMRFTPLKGRGKLAELVVANSLDSCSRICFLYCVTVTFG